MEKYDVLFSLNKLIFNVYGKVLNIRRYPLLRQDKKLLKKNKELKKIKKSKHCFIIGLGPSLKNVDFKKLDGDIIVTNRFFKVEGTEHINPILYVFSDNDFFNGKCDNDLNLAIKKYPNTQFILNGQYSDSIRKRFPKNDNFFYFYSWNGFLKGKKDKIDCCKVLPMSNNVVCTAIYAALYMQYDEIVLLGCDFNSFASTKAVHAYKENDDKRLWTMSSELFQYSFAADLHTQLNIYANLNNQKIINATNGSLIDAYERDETNQYYG